MTLQSSAHTNHVFCQRSSTYIYKESFLSTIQAAHQANVLVQDTHLHPLAVAQTNSRPPGCTAIARGVSAASSPTTTLACETTSSKQARISSGRDQTGPPSRPRGKQSPLTRGSEARAEAPASNSRRSTSGGDDAVAPRPNATRRRLTPGGPSSSRRRIHAAQVTFPTAPSPPFPAIATAAALVSSVLVGDGLNGVLQFCSAFCWRSDLVLF